MVTSLINIASLTIVLFFSIKPLQNSHGYNIHGPYSFSITAILFNIFIYITIEEPYGIKNQVWL